MSKPSTVKNVVVEYAYVEREIRISWDAVLGPDAACIDGYNVYRDRVPYGDFTDRTNPILVDGLCFIDAPDIIPNTDYYYKVTAINYGGEESNKQAEPVSYFPYEAFDTSPFVDLKGQELDWQPDNLQMKYFFEEIRKRAIWMLEQDGTIVKLYKRKWKTLQEEEPYGRRGEYYSGFNVRIRIVPTPRALIMEERGMRYVFTPRSWTIWTPLVANWDFIVTTDNKRYEITNITRNVFRGLITTQTFELVELPPQDDAYNINY